VPANNKVMELIQGGDRSKWIAQSNHNIKCFTEGEIKIITNNYRTILGRGSFGEVYRGVLQDGSVVAVKRFIHNVKENFAQELTVHREINHKNVVRLIGYCVEENALMMVTEYIANGNLSGILHDGNVPIPLDIRLRIAIECAEALVYMHSYMYTQVIHGDIKPANILLDGGLKAKVSDFGISRIINTDKTLFTKHVIGSIGYMDPLFARDGRLTAKSDVYSFGVVLVELITRKKAAMSDGEADIVYVFTNALAKGVRGVREIFDAEIASQNNMKILEGVAKLAGECLRMERERRSDVRESLTPGTKTSRFVLLGTEEQAKSLCADPGKNCRVYYHGDIDGEATKVAVKRLRISDQLYFKGHNFGYCGFRSVIEVKSKLCHRHIVPLIGYCDDNGQRFLVYKFMAHGSLYEHLYMKPEPGLSWKQRLEICIGAARGLRHLHRCAEHAIVHGNLKSTNILLDNNWVAKITDGLFCSTAKSYLISNDSYSFLDPEYKHIQNLTEESDVYAFGVLLFEVLSAKVGRILPINYLLRCALLYKEGKLNEFFDCSLKKNMDPHSLKKFVEAAGKCIAERGIDRPSMEEVLSDLEYTLQLQFNAESSGS
ncbi:hypothetical protein EJB05_27317, partial [Eragrostis curvula]